MSRHPALRPFVVLVRPRWGQALFLAPQATIPRATSARAIWRSSSKRRNVLGTGPGSGVSGHGVRLPAAPNSQYFGLRSSVGRATAYLAGLAAVVIAGLAHAAATPVSPPPGAVVSSSHPLFTWTVPPNEQSNTIYVASAPQTTPKGQFFNENVVDFDFFTRDEREWSPTSALYAGSYWWIVGTRDRDTFESQYSSPSAFRIPAAVKIVSVRLRRNSYTFVRDSLSITVRWSANARELAVSAAVSRAGRRLWRARESETPSIGSTGTSFFEWTKPRRMRQGTRLRVTVALRAGTATKTAVRTVRAP